MLALVRNRGIDIHRHYRRGDNLRAPEAHLDALAATGSVEDQAVTEDQSTRLRVSLQQLPEGQCQVIALAYFGGLTHREIAEQLKLPLGTVKGRMRLGLAKARSEIEDRTAIRDGAGNDTQGS
ncbi:MAG: RNA polymerase sigma factor [Solirubrobacteraceae bacterium]